MNDFAGQQKVMPLSVGINFRWGPIKYGEQLSNAVTAPSSSAWPAANRAYYIPMAVPIPYLVKRLWLVVGSTTGGNVDIGLYNKDGAQIYHSGSTVLGAISTMQTFDLTTPILLSPGVYYLAQARDAITSQGFYNTVSIISSRLAGIYQQSTAFPLPATATFAQMGSAIQPIMGMSCDTRGF